jgi:glycerate kinase
VKIVIAPDSFKGSLSAKEVCCAVEAGLRSVWGDAHDIVSVPVADGGEGTVQALVDATGGEFIEVVVTGPLGEPVRASYALLGSGRTAALEMAVASGFSLVPPERRDPTVTTTLGTGELIADALGRGIRSFIIGIGGSATNDGGAGVAQALGYRLLDAEGRELPLGGLALRDLARIECPRDLRRRLPGLDVRVACDVDNPLCGPRGASAVYGPQKGATHEQVVELDAALANLAAVVRRDLGPDILDLPGSGAAGGLGGGLVAFLGGRLMPGAEIVLEAVRLPEALAGADLCVTGEGLLDSQTQHGKTPAAVAETARAAGVPVVAVGGAVDPAAAESLSALFDAVIASVTAPCATAEALSDARRTLVSAAAGLARLLTLGGRLPP